MISLSNMTQKWNRI